MRLFVSLVLIYMSHVVTANVVDDSRAEAEQCCSSVPPVCRRLCDRTYMDEQFAFTGSDRVMAIGQIVNDIDRHCREHLDAVSNCLNLGRNNSRCCSTQMPNNDYSPTIVDCVEICDDRPLPPFTKDFSNCVFWFAEKFFKCFDEGYNQRPTAPRNVMLSSKTTTSLTVSWDRPSTNPSSGAGYAVHFTTDPPTGTNHVTVMSGAQSTVIHGLDANTDYTITVVVLNARREALSFHSAPIVMRTEGERPTIEPYEAIVTHAISTSATLVCYAHSSGRRDDQETFEWHFDNRRVSPTQSSTEQYSVTVDGRRRHVMTLHVESMTRAQFGKYTCSISNQFGRAEAQVRLVRHDHNVNVAPELDRNSTQCCVERGVSRQCLHRCGGPRGTSTPACQSDSTLIADCMGPSQSIAACCIREHVDPECLWICETTHSHINAHKCPVDIKGDVATCLKERQSAPSIPHAPQFDEDKSGVRSIALRWSRVSGAVSYVIYYTSTESGRTESKVITSLSTIIDGLSREGSYEIYMIAQNASGYSEKSRSLKIRMRGGRASQIN